MTKKKIAQSKRGTKGKPVDAEIRRAAERAGIAASTAPPEPQKPATTPEQDLDSVTDEIILAVTQAEPRPGVRRLALDRMIARMTAHADEIEPPDLTRRGKDLERQVLAFAGESSLASTLRRMLSLGQYVDPQGEHGLRIEDVQRKWAVATLRAVAIAVESESYSDSATDLRFDGRDAASVLAGVVAVLEDGFDLDGCLPSAPSENDEGEQAAGGAP